MPSVVQPKVDISRALTIHGWMSENELLWLATQAYSHRYIVEFGSFHGRSAKAMADNMMPHGKIFCVDPWGGNYKNDDGETLEQVNTYCMPIFLKNLHEYIVKGQVVPVREFSYRFSLPFKADMVFIDGDHRYNTVVKDIKKAYELLRDGGIISGHDYSHVEWDGVKKAVDEYVGPVEVIDTIWFTTKR